mgnify:CR=1 FL=1
MKCFPRNKAPDSSLKALDNFGKIGDKSPYTRDMCTPKVEINIADVSAGSYCKISPVRVNSPSSVGKLPAWMRNGHELKTQFE